MAVRRRGETAVAADGKVSSTGEVAFTGHVRQVHRLGSRVLCASCLPWGALSAIVAALTRCIEQYPSDLPAAARAFALENDSQRPEAFVLADPSALVLVTARCEVFEPEDGVAALGEGAGCAAAAGKALVLNTQLSAEQIVRESLRIAGELRGWTADELVLEVV